MPAAKKYHTEQERRLARNARTRAFRASLPQDERDRRNKERYAKNISRLEYKISTRLQLRLYRVRPDGPPSDAIKYLGCTVSELCNRLELQWQPGMDWDSYGSGKDKWQLDHRTALRNHDLSDPKQLAAACHFSNIRPVWLWQNIHSHWGRWDQRRRYIPQHLWKETA